MAAEPGVPKLQVLKGVRALQIGGKPNEPWAALVSPGEHIFR